MPNLTVQQLIDKLNSQDPPLSESGKLKILIKAFDINKVFSEINEAGNFSDLGGLLRETDKLCYAILQLLAPHLEIQYASEQKDLANTVDAIKEAFNPNETVDASNPADRSQGTIDIQDGDQMTPAEPRVDKDGKITH
ncbi:MAG: hypothetical protein CMB80_16390 [Flammeovirgaceae bacterium]|nr:hypothetical protein [Flammeovirgaceae bacterium]